MVLRDVLSARSGGGTGAPGATPRAGSSRRPAGRARSTKMDALCPSVFPVSTLCLAAHISGGLFLFQRIVSWANQ